MGLPRKFLIVVLKLERAQTSVGTAAQQISCTVPFVLPSTEAQYLFLYFGKDQLMYFGERWSKERKEESKTKQTREVKW
jgi:hypothetical protein